MAHFVIMGCGRVGMTLAHTLEDAGHTVAIIGELIGELSPDEQADLWWRTGTRVYRLGRGPASAAELPRSDRNMTIRTTKTTTRT